MIFRGWSRLAIAGAVGACLFGAVGTSAQSVRRVDRPVAMRSDPVVVELFTAQGCGGCPEANQRVETLVGRPGVIVLTYPVDYWDYTGWADTLARPEFSARQQEYRQALRLRAVATPQVILDGHRTVAPPDEDTLGLAVNEEAARSRSAPDIEFRETGDRVGIGSGRVAADGAEVLAVVFRPGPVLVRVESGDNRGRVVRHTNVVQSIQPIGEWTGRPILLSLPTDIEAGDRVAVLVQSRDDRQILGAAVR
ncbi:DUF1223 domain-containing protein [Brevundimonas sp.]|uniref:DUF1223 domain-containing protein n=1 Tax=Brevundimonas sp. TaxID=1871086 RepID=UPI001DDB51B7|nr:DUF1223 domain-containing protein [Brevundimonas sp.]MBL0947919.1 DUF1223 domain-containing protein [Brevundimonas sp.]